MVDTYSIAIADILEHPVYGIVSHQPDLCDPIQDEIRVMDTKGNYYKVLASECNYPDDSIDFWADFWDLLPSG